MSWTPPPHAVARVRGYARGFCDGAAFGLGTRRRALHAELVETRRERDLREDQLNVMDRALDRMTNAYTAAIEETAHLREQLAAALEDLGDRRGAVVDIDDEPSGGTS